MNGMPDDLDFRALLAQNLKRARKNRGWSQLALANELGVSPQFISNIELGNRWASPETLRALCGALHVQPHQLFITEDPADVARDVELAQIREELTARTREVIEAVCFKYLG